ncbi:MAG: twin-arginine translocase TatA/TatE family subunit [Porphyromonadaceae bacterium]|nr:twin-arginine translocase TatA/TatE family subunit [Porphyromonadaceae bacterium]
MNNFLFIGNLGLSEILVIALIILLLFGGKKIPELMKGLGKGVRSFKEGMNDLEKGTELDEKGNARKGDEGNSETPQA